MARKIKGLLKTLFDYQKFEQNERLNYEINNVYEKNRTYLLEDNNLLAVVGGRNKNAIRKAFKPDSNEEESK